MLRYAAVVLGVLSVGLARPAAAVDAAQACPHAAEALLAVQGWSVVISPAGNSPAKAERLITCLPANVLVIAPTPDRQSAGVAQLPASR